MKVKSLYVQNFLAIGEAALELSERGLILVSGDNKTDSSASSNGAGKSSLADAIAFAIWGETARGQSGDDVINNVAKKDCQVIVVLSDETGDYSITRTRKDAKLGSTLNLHNLTTNTNLTCGTMAETQKKIESLLGMSKDIFDASIYLGQERMPDLPSMTDKQLKLMIEEAAGVTRLQKAHEIAKSRLATVQNARDVAIRMLERVIDDINRNQLRIASIERESADWAETRKQRLKDKAETYKARKEELEFLKTEIAKHDLTAIHDDIKTIDEAIAKTDSERNALDELKRGETKAMMALAGVEKTAEAAVKAYKLAMAEKDKAHDRVGTPCRECGRTHDEETLKSLIIAAKQKFDHATDEAHAVKAQLEVARKALSDAQERVSKAEASQTDIKALLTRRSELETRLRTVGPLAGQIKSKAELVTRLHADALAIKGETNPYQAQLDSLRTQIDEGRRSANEKSLEFQRLEESYKLHAAAVDVFGTAGVRAHILDIATPFLNARTAHYLGHLSDGNISAQWSTLSATKKGDIREKFKIEVAKTIGADSFKGLSGGEKRKARLSCAMALQDLVAARAEKPFHLFVADEIDDAVDEAGLERLMAILEEKARERETVLVISHNSLNAWIRKEITVVNEGGVAHVVDA